MLDKKAVWLEAQIALVKELERLLEDSHRAGVEPELAKIQALIAICVPLDNGEPIGFKP